jgi:FlaA1/EpsC-like NDP-sugar epimerase
MRPRTLMSTGRTILVTGAGGSIGSRLAKALSESHPHALILLDQSEHNLYRIQAELSATPGCVDHLPILGDICDGRLVADVVERYRPEVIYHSAAFKHVPLMEANPLAAIRNNALGTLTLAKAATEQAIPKLIMISTDKAVNPRSVMGASKRIAELVLTRWNGALTRMRAIRLGNVLGSKGSVEPLFREQISRGGPLTVTHPQVERYFVSMNQATELILAMSDLVDEGTIFVPEMSDAVPILELARRLVLESGLRPEEDVPIVFTNLRPGDKMTEDLTSEAEFLQSTSDPRLYRVRASLGLPNGFDDLMSDLVDSLSSRDVAAVLAVVSRLVPEYRPSGFLVESLDRDPV